MLSAHVVENVCLGSEPLQSIRGYSENQSGQTRVLAVKSIITLYNYRGAKAIENQIHILSQSVKKAIFYWHSEIPHGVSELHLST